MPCRAQSSGGTHAKNIALRSLDYGRYSLRVFKISAREGLSFKFYKGILLAASVFLLKISMRSYGADYGYSRLLGCFFIPKICVKFYTRVCVFKTINL